MSVNFPSKSELGGGGCRFHCWVSVTEILKVQCCEDVLGCKKSVLQRMTQRFLEEHPTFGFVTHVEQVAQAIGEAMETIELSCALSSPYSAEDQASIFTFMHLGALQECRFCISRKLPGAAAQLSSA